MFDAWGYAPIGAEPARDEKYRLAPGAPMSDVDERFRFYGPPLQGAIFGLADGRRQFTDGLGPVGDSMKKSLKSPTDSAVPSMSYSSEIRLPMKACIARLPAGVA
jgi:hypothetical protein